MGEVYRALDTRLQRIVAVKIRFALDYAMLGRKDEAFRELNHFLEDDPTGANWYIRRPEYDGLRSDPRYAELLRRTYLPQ